MAGERYADKAIVKLLSYFETNLGTYLDALETAQSLTAGTMTHPVDYVPGYFPDDTRSPLFQAWVDTGEPHNEDPVGRNGVYAYQCNVMVSFASDADVETGQTMARRYMTALIDCLAASRTLSGTVVHAIDQGQKFYGPRPDATTRHAVEMAIEVVVHEV